MRSEPRKLRYPLVACMVVALGVATLALGASGKTTVSIWTPHDFDVRFGDVHEVLWRPFEVTNPDIQIEWVRTTGNWEEKIRVALASGVAPDIFAVDGINVPAYASQGWIAPLPQAVIPDSMRKDYWPPTLDEMMWDGQLYALGLETNSHLLFYNTSILSKAGLTPPQHWEELMRLGSHLTIDLNNDGLPDQWALEMTLGWGEYGMWICSAWIWQNRGEIYKDGKILVDRPEAIDAMQFMGDLVHKYRVIPGPGQQQQGFFQEGAAMVISGPFNFGPLWKDAPSVEWDVVPTPWPMNGVRVSGVGGWHFGLSGQTKVRDAAYQVMRYIASEPFVETLATSYGVPLRRSVALRKEQYRSGVWKVAVEQMMYGKARPRTPQYPDLTRIMSDAFVAVNADNRPAREVAENAARQMRELGIGE